MKWTSYGYKTDSVVFIYNLDDKGNDPLGVGVELELTAEQSKALRKEMKAAEKVARGE